MNRWLAYFLISIPISIVLMKIIESKNEVFLWTYFAVMGISALISKWFSFSEKNNKFLKITYHIGIISTMSLFLWSFFYWIFNK